MQTVTIIAGNSDNGLSQADWSALVANITRYVQRRAAAVEFTGGPATASPFQNYAWVIRLHPAEFGQLREEIKVTRAQFRQESVAWISGVTEFI